TSTLAPLHSGAFFVSAVSPDLQRTFVVFSGSVDRTQSHRPLVNIYRTNGEEIGKKLLKKGFARSWSPRQRNDWCS
ncbi:thermonuclease family protein, partial [Rhizobium beringeri]